MAQYLKGEIEERILAAGARVFAEKGYAAATMAQISAAAGISTGNVYRYFENKAVLFDAVLPDSFVRELSGLIRHRVEALRGVSDVAELPADAPWRRFSEELLGFCIDNRLRVIVLLCRTEGTAHEGFADKLVRNLVELAIAWGRSVHPEQRLRPTARFALESIYRGFLEAMVAILQRFEDEAAIRAAIVDFSAYHLAGLRAFFQEDR